MISAGVEGRLPYMTYPEPWRGPPKPSPEFLRPAPKPVPSIRYNGISTSSTPNGTRLAAPPARPLGKYPSSPHTASSLAAPVNLTKDEVSDELSYSPYSLYPHPSTFSHFGHYSLYPQYTHIIRASYPPSTPISPLEAYSPTTPTASAASSSTFLPPAATFSPPATIVKPGQSILKEKRTPPAQSPHTAASTPPQQQPQSQVSFKVPSKESTVSLKGKEGSLKHRILTRPEDGQKISIPLDLQQKQPSQNVTAPRKRLPATITSPPSPRSPHKAPTSVGNISSGYSKGQLVQLASGDFRRIEDMRTEDFILSAQNSPELRLANSTVLKIEEDHRTGKATVTLSYNERRTQVDIESSSEHPYYVYGQGWASCNPDRTLQVYGLAVHRLQVGDILISLTPREQPLSSPSTKTPTIMTTATTTAMSVRPAPPATSNKTVTIQPVPHIQHIQLLQQSPQIAQTAQQSPQIPQSAQQPLQIMHTAAQVVQRSPHSAAHFVQSSGQSISSPAQILQQSHHMVQPVQIQPMNLHTSIGNSMKLEANNIGKQLNDAPLSPESLAARKRRWSAPDEISAQEEQQVRKSKLE